MQKDYIVAGHAFSVRIPDEKLDMFCLDQYAPFETHTGPAALFSLEVVDCLCYEKPVLEMDQPTEEGETKIVLWRAGKDWLFTMSPDSSRPISAELILSEDFKSARMKLIRPEEATFSLNNSLMLAYALCTATLGTLEVHASVVANDGRAYLFMAKSGTGKSTHSKMWMRNIPGTHLLNDDNPVVRVHDDGSVIVYGTPWSGKTPCYRNEQYPVGAFVKIVRAPHNELVRMNIIEAYANLYSSCSGYKADSRMADGLHETISAAACTIPSFAMNCLPDGEAALVCHAGVKEAKV